MWQAENPELAREFPVGTASKARQSRLHQAQGVFLVFVFAPFSFYHFVSSSLPLFASSSLRLTRQLMDINGETFLARSAPRKNWERT